MRCFNRFHTRLAGALNEHLLASDYSLPQVRVLYEIANGTDVSATDLTRGLRVDRGYVSRLLSGLEACGLIGKAPAEGNAPGGSVTRSGSRGDRRSRAGQCVCAAGRLTGVSSPMGARVSRVM